jgi:hypothetical protein
MPPALKRNIYRRLGEDSYVSSQRVLGYVEAARFSEKLVTVFYLFLFLSLHREFLNLPSSLINKCAIY